MFSNQLFSLWPTNHWYMERDNSGLEYYDPSCVNVGLHCHPCKADKSTPYTGDKPDIASLSNCFNCGSKEGFLSDRPGTFDRRFFDGQGKVEDDLKFPRPIRGAPTRDSEYAPLNSAGGREEIGYMPQFSPDGFFYTEYVEVDDRLKDYKRAHGY